MGRQGVHLRRLRRADAGDRGAVRHLRLLLDTHVVVWWLNEPGRLAQAAREAIEDPASEVLVSAASVWEAAIKTAAGRLTTPTPLIEAVTAAGFRELPISWKDGEGAAALPDLHRDPFDRMLIAQALDRGLVLVTRDAVVRQYAVPTLAA